MTFKKIKDMEEIVEPMTPKLIEDEYDPEDGLPTKLEHFDIYNKYARKNKLPVQVPTEDFYPKFKVKFQRFDQPDNVLKVLIHKKHIHWQGQLKPGNTYNLCLPVIQFLNALSEPIFAEVKVTDGGDTLYETKQVGERARFSCQNMEFLAA